jgi:hypothetical protein
MGPVFSDSGTIFAHESCGISQKSGRNSPRIEDSDEEVELATDMIERKKE